MSTDRSLVPAGGAPESIGSLKADIERTRAELADTVEGLMYHLDVPARTKEKIAEETSKLKKRVEELQAKARQTWDTKPIAVVGGGAAVVGVVVLAVVAKRRGSS